MLFVFSLDTARKLIQTDFFFTQPFASLKIFFFASLIIKDWERVERVIWQIEVALLEIKGREKVSNFCEGRWRGCQDWKMSNILIRLLNR